MELVKKIDMLEKESVITSTLRRETILFPGFSDRHRKSFAKWRERLVTHPDFLSQPPQEQTDYLERLGDLERQFLFYKENPRLAV